MKEQIEALKLCIDAIDCIGSIGNTPPHYVDMVNVKLAKAYTAAKKAIKQAENSAGEPAWLNQVLNEGDGTYKP